MGKITILEETTKRPITLIGKRAGICTGTNILDDEENYARGMDCIKSEHGRVLEFVNVEMILEGYSARVLREYYTHIGGAPTRLQASTRYINYNDFKYVIPESIRCDKRFLNMFEGCIKNTKETMKTLKDMGVPREDIAMLMPLGMKSTMVDKRNLRNLIEMSHQRECSRANWEYRELFNDIKISLKKYAPESNEWDWIIDNFFMPKCKYFGKCTEKKSCGLINKKE